MNLNYFFLRVTTIDSILNSVVIKIILSHLTDDDIVNLSFFKEACEFGSMIMMKDYTV